MNKDILKALEGIGVNTPLQYEKNANEVMNTGATGYGEELVPAEQLAKDIFDAIPEYGTFLNALPGFHGSGLNKVEVKPIIGDVGLFNKGSEQTTSALAVAQGDTRLATGEVTLTQAKMEMTIDVSDELATFNVADAPGFEAKLKEKITKAAARTVEALIINGDTATGATGNVNSDDEAPGGTEYYLAANGLRKTGIAASDTINVGTAEFADLISVTNLLGDYFASPEDCMFLFNRSTYNKYLGVSEFSDHSKNGKGSTINGKAITNILGADVFVSRDLNKTEADGKISYDTPANNTLGQFLAFWKPAVQYGYGKELQLKLMDFGKDGYQLQGWFYVAVSIISEKAGVTDPSVGVGINVTV